jgi:hypothetical protein
MSKPAPPSCRTKTWCADSAAPKLRGLLQTRFDPATVWLAEPSGKRGRSAPFPDAAIQACLTLKSLLGLPLRQTTGLVASLLHLAGLDWAVPDFCMLSRRQKGLNVAFPCRPSTGALHLSIPSRDIASQCPAGQGTAPGSRPREKASGLPSGLPRNMELPGLDNGARSIWVSMRILWKAGR